ncbi:hypothetical protein C6P45_004673 [Maudiozyma exigua]|uniref:DNA mismatch repair protein S5 domain-containing protein n=1 Tax=Maudiozyma exigua TaxID=34358 RepID=A0A9P6WCD6_MAUEX|nr:hypothetical protein C6P45_004673 [Kazachstania exigua]
MVIHKIHADSQWKITSGSFIHGPRAAIKELIDNSIDAGSKTIYIDVDSKTGGCDYFSVRDDGTGVKEDDRPLLCQNHTTSKIDSFDDLSSLSVLGFRGEALFMLATLCAELGSMQIITKTKDDSIGMKWFVDKNGNMKKDSLCKASSPDGTTVTIRNLLGGLRSRDIDMRSNVRITLEELKYMINHYILDFRNIRFNLSYVSLKKNGSIASKMLQQSIAINVSKVRALSSIVQLRKPVSLNFVEIDKLEINKHISMNLILPRMLMSSDVVDYKKMMKFISVNERAMSLRLFFGKEVNKMINSIYRDMGLLEPHVWYINFKIDMKIVDINIEPEKNDILLKDHDNVMIQIRNCIEQKLVLELDTKPEPTSDDPSKISHDPLSQSQNISKEINLSIIDDTEDSTVIQPNQSKEASNDKNLFVPNESYDLTLPRPPISDTNKISNSFDGVKTIDLEEEDNDDIDWRHSFLEKSPSVQIDLIGSDGDSDKQSSLRFGDGNGDDVPGSKEDIQISKDMSLSNPFILLKMNNSHKKKKQAAEMVVEPANEITFNELVNKKRRLSEDTQDRLINLKDRAVKKSNGTLQKKLPMQRNRSIQMFSEYTNSQLLTLRYSLDKDYIVKNETEFADELTDNLTPTQNIRGKLENLLPNLLENGSSLEDNLTVNEFGWCLFNNDGSNSRS